MDKNIDSITFKTLVKGTSSKLTYSNNGKTIMETELTTEPTEPTLPAGDGCGDMGDGVPIDRLFQLLEVPEVPVEEDAPGVW